MNIIMDASAIITMVIDEPEKNLIINLTKDVELFSPEMISFEIGNALTRLKRRQILNDEEIIKAYNVYKEIPVRLVEVNIENALKIACQYNIYAYDAYYLEVAFRLRLPLLTLDKLMKNIAREMNLNILEERDENI
ncbi:MAG: type II toxin-antitoxin system VapC family toxin [Treponema sp.]|jgi:predicted nucleic acid-binding protein|nr:type II toxin-antitoxin system VapC family toxin [Treponema sp.]